MSLLILPALLLGLFGSLHCAAMCGGILTAALVAPRKVRLPQMQAPMGPTIVRLNVGRIVGYSMAGAVAGGFGHIVQRGLAQQGRQGLLVASAVLLVWMGVSQLGVLPGRFTLERFLGGSFRLSAPLRARLLPTQGALRDLTLGLLWGLLPCGLVYGALALAMSSGSPQGGALVMLAFGLGTAPALAVVSMLAQRLRQLASRPKAKLAVGLVMLGLGLLQLQKAVAPVEECCAAQPAALAPGQGKPTAMSFP